MVTYIKYNILIGMKDISSIKMLHSMPDTLDLVYYNYHLPELLSTATMTGCCLRAN